MDDKMRKNLTYIDLFSGCGGLSLGLYQSGWNGLFAIEKNPYAFSTLSHNLIDNLCHFDWPDWLELKNHDIDEVLTHHVNDLKRLRGEVDLVVGGPPCQGFSMAGRREESDTRNELIHSYIQFIRIVQPKLVFFENVKGFTQRFNRNKSKGYIYSQYVQESLQETGEDYMGYDIHHKLINFSDYGIPQNRTRFILVGIRKDLHHQSSTAPESFFQSIEAQREQHLLSKGMTTKTSLYDALSDLFKEYGVIDCPDSKRFKSGLYGEVGSNYQHLLRGDKLSCANCPDSHRFPNHSSDTTELFFRLITTAPINKRITGKERKSYSVRRRGITVLDKNEQSPTLTSNPDDYVHFSEPRILTVREYARIQSFPDWFQFRGKYTTGGQLRKTDVPRYTQVANAIPPLFAEQAGLSLKRMIDGQ